MADATCRWWSVFSTLLLFVPMAYGQTAIQSLVVDNPRSYGYHIGDRFERRVTLTLNKPYQLLMDSLPESGRINLWLDLESPQLESRASADETTYVITLRYQLINIPLSRQALDIAVHRLKFSDQYMQLSAQMPAWRFGVIPVAGEGDDLQAPQPPPLLELGPYLWRIGLALALLIIALLVLAYSHWTLPWIKRANGPFARALRELKRSDQSEPERIRCLHRAFDQTAGRTLFAEKLAGFFAEQPAYTVLQTPIEQFFTHSRNLFFESEYPSQLDQQGLLKLCQDCRDVERGLR